MTDAAMARPSTNEGAHAAEHFEGSMALTELLHVLAGEGYRFITPTPLTHARVLARPGDRKSNSLLRDVFGWSRPFGRDKLPARMVACLDAAGMLIREGDVLRSGVRVSSLGDDLFLHSAYPTLEANDVFFGPDTYRFCRFIGTELARMPDAPACVFDVGCGTGAGAVAAQRVLAGRGQEARLVLGDINPRALQFAACNLDAASLAGSFTLGDGLGAAAGEFDLVVANPPYMADPAHRAYRDGGAGLGRALSVRLAKEALDRLAPGGRLALYTGVAIVDGVDPFLDELLPALEASGHAWRYGEIDPDVFGEEIQSDSYKDVDRIAAVGLVVTRRAAA